MKKSPELTRQTLHLYITVFATHAFAIHIKIYNQFFYVKGLLK